MRPRPGLRRHAITVLLAAACTTAGTAARVPGVRPDDSRAIPPRMPGALTGTAFFAQLIAAEDSVRTDLDRDRMRRLAVADSAAALATGGTGATPAADLAVRALSSAREAAILRELRAGNLPAFLRRFRTVRDSARDAAGVLHRIEYEVMPDYLAIGSDEDFVRAPMTPRTAQAFADAAGLVLPTRRMVDATWRAAAERRDPIPLTEAREAAHTFLDHHRLIERQGRAAPGTDAGAPAAAREPRIIAGIKKDVILTNRLAERGDRVAIYGWHGPTGVPIQPVYVGHVDWYVDYSHGIRLARRMMRVDGRPMGFERIATDPVLHVLVSDEGPLTVLRYQRPEP